MNLMRASTPATAPASAAAGAPRRLPRMASAVRTEAGLFALGVVLIAIHVIDDSFVQPQPGTWAGDHVFNGLIPVTFLGLAAWVYPRLRAGARGALALALVLPAVLSGSEAIYYAGKTGLSGDDYTGLLAIGAAPLLLAVGAWTLWTSRRLGDHVVRRYARRLLKGADDAGHRNPDYYRAAKQPKQIWEAEGGHTEGIAKQPAEYERRVVGFLDRSLLGSR
jgi:hypothetical protein